ncbi:hypothetical protein [Asaia krungthepensis]|nr:hypothetical protein [Asaia krungthepensis]
MPSFDLAGYYALPGQIKNDRSGIKSQFHHPRTSPFGSNLR